MITKIIHKKLAPLLNYYIPLRLPRLIALEATNRCFLECQTCPIPKKMTRPKGEMSLETFNILLSKIDWMVERLSWAFGGEQFINKNILEMARLSEERQIPSKIDTNGMLLQNFIGELFTCRLLTLNIAFEGLSRESTSDFRLGYDYNLVISNIKEICLQKRKRKKKYPVISLNYLVKRDNENEIEDTIRLAKEWGVDFIVLKSINLNPSQWLSDSDMQDLGDKFLPNKYKDYLRYTQENGKWIPKYELSNFCRYILNSVTITWDGKVLPCCQDFDATMIVGDIIHCDLKTIWRSKRFREIRREILSKSLPLCKNCISAVYQKKIILNH